MPPELELWFFHPPSLPDWDRLKLGIGDYFTVSGIRAHIDALALSHSYSGYPCFPSMNYTISCRDETLTNDILISSLRDEETDRYSCYLPRDPSLVLHCTLQEGSFWDLELNGFPLQVHFAENSTLSMCRSFLSTLYKIPYDNIQLMNSSNPFADDTVLTSIRSRPIAFEAQDYRRVHVSLSRDYRVIFPPGKRDSF
jgi:hypothetical protein